MAKQQGPVVKTLKEIASPEAVAATDTLRRDEAISQDKIDALFGN